MIIKTIRNDSRRLVLLTTIFGLITTSLVLICPFILSKIIDDISSDTQINQSINKIVLIVLIYLATYIINLIAMYLINKFSAWYKTKISMKLYSVLINMEYAKIIEKQPLYLADRMFKSVESIYNYYSDVTKTYIISSIKIFIALILISVYSWIIAIVLLFISLIYIGIYYSLNKKLQKKCETLSKKNSMSFSNILAIINEVDYIKMTDRKQENLINIEKSISSVNNENMKVTNFASLISLTADSLINISFVICSVILAIMFASGNISIGQYVMLQNLSNLIFPSITSIINSNVNARDIKASISFIEDEMEKHIEKFGNEKIDKINSINLDIDSYKIGDKQLYKNLKWNIVAGDKIVLYGESGSGKSTIIKAIMGYNKIENVFINNKNINTLDIDYVRSKIYYLSQNVPIIPGTIEDNILLGSKNNKIEELLNYTFMKSLLNGRSLSDNIYQRANNISGGEKQKVALARLFLSNPDVILLDECFSALDQECKLDTIKELNEKFKDKIIVLISHDDSIASYFKKCYELKNNKIVEQ